MQLFLSAKEVFDNGEQRRVRKTSAAQLSRRFVRRIIAGLVRHSDPVNALPKNKRSETVLAILTTERIDKQRAQKVITYPSAVGTTY